MSDWISVKDRLPENHRAVFVVLKEHGRSKPEIMRHYKKLGWQYGLHIYDFYTVTHWQDLPKLPQT